MVLANIPESAKYFGFYLTAKAVVEGGVHEIPKLQAFGEWLQEVFDQLKFSHDLYEAYLIALGMGIRLSTPKAIAEVRQNIGRYHYWFGGKEDAELLRRMASYLPSFRLNDELIRQIASLNGLVAIEDALQEEAPVKAIALFLARRERQETVLEIQRFAKRLFASYFCPPLELFLEGFDFLARHSIETSIKRRDDLLRLFDQGGKGALKRMVEEENDTTFLTKRREALAKNELKVGDETFRFSAVLSELQPLAARHLTFIVEGGEYVIRLGRHPLSLVLEEDNTGCSLPLLRPIWIKEGVGLYPRLMRLSDIFFWEGEALDEDQRLVLQRIAHLLAWLRQNNQIIAPHTLAKIGLDAEGNLFAVSRIDVEPFSESKLENVLKGIANDNLPLFMELIRPWEGMLAKWPLQQELQEWMRDFVRLGKLPPPAQKMTRDFMVEVDRQTLIYNALIEEGYPADKIACAMSGWRTHTRIIQSFWERERGDLIALMQAFKIGPESLSHELKPAYQIAKKELAYRSSS